MTHQMNILIIGDSFAADWSAVDSTYPGWPQLLAKKHSVTNLAQAGCSEYKILQQLKTQQNLNSYDWIIVCHTSLARIHTRKHPVHHSDQLHAHADLIFSDIEYHTALDKKQKNRALVSAHDFFVYHYDDDYNRNMHQLIVKEIHQIIGNTPVVVVDNFNQLNPSDYKFFLDFTKITQVIPGKINHCSSQGNIDICHSILDIIDQAKSVLPGMVLRSLRLAELDYLAPDDPAVSSGFDTNYPWPVTYKFNSRGYRDLDWPKDLQTLKSSIWCIGDSATMGIGVPIEHSWPSQLEQKLNNRTIKIAMLGASNEWITRKITSLVKEIHPSTIVVHWSFTHRRELAEVNLPQVANLYWKTFYNAIRDADWPDVDLHEFNTLPDVIKQEINDIHYNPNIDKFNFDSIDYEIYDEDRILHYAESANTADNTENLLACVSITESLAQKHGINLIHSFVPRFAPAPESRRIMQKMQELNLKFVPELVQVDLARDGFHYDIKTATNLVDQVIELM